ncbi:hypothetical protein COCSUDRAFT_63602 [Coccomyxa subellipsoidea C-169]|uniref:Glycosyltransferase 61 catalytic domain-containing protein n=1 Tax=Coccomyxa subellipsoidea (strain C-169) TaxID=574566 RepID=I0YXX7_COCSC|nr:hypothetical protein COCSUDRAFT_63602 [Coccomyxa subellipsoidea C-169]EIE23246.1 hypothetical protein COCSUDRAFT_63602 [Coccomyxa subellipsoidea C-169]|eukprot:XP_005647790.1 hypothetical protein COCSUDRAFT_63602 [Coccomyxa subellipsoidea C-169]
MHAGHVTIEPYILPWAPTVVTRAIPRDAAYASQPVAVYASTNDYAFNYGHALFDFLYAVFNQLQTLQLYTPDFQLLLAQHQGTNPDAINIFINPENSERSLLRMISRNPVLPLHEFRAAGSEAADLTCVKTLVAGSAHMHLTLARARALPFRAAAMVNLGVNDQGLARQPRITLLDKRGKRRIENLREIAAALAADFPRVQVVVVNGASIERMSIRQQLELMASTTVLITPCGGLGTVSVFLPPGGTAIVMNYYNTARNTSTQMENIYYSNVEYVDYQYFPVVLEDYEGTSDRPGCENHETAKKFATQGKLINCNLRIKDLWRIRMVVNAAVMRWAARDENW